MGDMDSVNFAINFLVDEVSGDSEYDSVGAAAAAAAASCGPDQRDHEEAIQEEYGRIDVGDDDRESAVDAAGSDMEGSEDGGELVGDSDREDHDDCVHSGEEEGMRWWSTAPEVGHMRYEKMEEEKGDQRRRVSAADPVEAARESDKRFWETCLASGYP